MTHDDWKTRSDRDENPYADDRPAYEDMPQHRGRLVGHSHRCWCGRWWHDDGDSDCELTERMTCVIHEGQRDPAGEQRGL